MYTQTKTREQRGPAETEGAAHRHRPPWKTSVQGAPALHNEARISNCQFLSAKVQNTKTILTNSDKILRYAADCKKSSDGDVAIMTHGWNDSQVIKAKSYLLIVSILILKTKHKS